MSPSFPDRLGKRHRPIRFGVFVRYRTIYSVWFTALNDVYGRTTLAIARLCAELPSIPSRGHCVVSEAQRFMKLARWSKRGASTRPQRSYAVYISLNFAWLFLSPRLKSGELLAELAECASDFFLRRIPCNAKNVVWILAHWFLLSRTRPCSEVRMSARRIARLCPGRWCRF
jgi:hypothetical protein